MFVMLAIFIYVDV